MIHFRLIESAGLIDNVGTLRAYGSECTSTEQWQRSLESRRGASDMWGGGLGKMKEIASCAAK